MNSLQLISCHRYLAALHLLLLGLLGDKSIKGICVNKIKRLCPPLLLGQVEKLTPKFLGFISPGHYFLHEIRVQMVLVVPVQLLLGVQSVKGHHDL